jgi:hypothetical protein
LIGAGLVERLSDARDALRVAVGGARDAEAKWLDEEQQRHDKQANKANDPTDMIGGRTSAVRGRSRHSSVRAKPWANGRSWADRCLMR